MDCERPPVVFIVMDTVRRDRVGSYGYDRQTTPHLDAFAADATVYEDAVAQGTWSVPSHASMLTGQYPHQHGATKLRPFLQEDTVFSELSAAGYDTVGVSENGYVRPFTGFDGFDTFHAHRRLFLPRRLHRPLQMLGNKIYSQPRIRAGMEQLYSWLLTAGRARRVAGEKEKDGLWTGRQASQVIREQQGDSPLCLFANIMDAHLPRSPLPQFRDALVANQFHDMEIPHHHRPFMYNQVEATVDERTALDQFYDADVRTSDEQLGRILATLREDGRYDDALVIVVADHGEHLGELDRFGHCHSTHDAIVSVPLLIKYPGQTSPHRVSGQVETRRLYHTIRDATGVADHPDMTLQAETSSRPAYGEFYPPMLDVDHIHEHRQARYDSDLQGSRLSFVRHDERKLVRTPRTTQLYRLPETSDAELDVDAHRETVDTLRGHRPATADTSF